MKSRKTDDGSVDFRMARKPRTKPEVEMLLNPGHIIIAEEAIRVRTIVGAGVVVTMFDSVSKQAAICHFLRPKPGPDDPITPMYGVPALAGMLRNMLDIQPDLSLIRTGIYGGSAPEWATPEQKKISDDNIEVVRIIFSRKNLKADDLDFGGSRGRKVIFTTDSNEIVVIKTELIRLTDWYDIPEVMGKSQEGEDVDPASRLLL